MMAQCNAFSVEMTDQDQKVNALLSADVINKLRQNGGVISISLRCVSVDGDRSLLAEIDAPAPDLGYKTADPQAAKPAHTQPQGQIANPTNTEIANKYLNKLNQRISEINAIVNRQEAIAALDSLQSKVYAVDSWANFSLDVEVANRASSLLTSVRSKLMSGSVEALPKPNIEARDFSDLISRLDVELDRLNLDKKIERMARFGDGVRSVDLSESDIRQWIFDLQKIEKPYSCHTEPPINLDTSVATSPKKERSPECNERLAKIKEVRTFLGMSPDDVKEIANHLTGKEMNLDDLEQLDSILNFLCTKKNQASASTEPVDNQEFF